VGKAFDPMFHEAVAYEDGDEGIVVSEHRKGYTIKDKVLRASQVSVGRGNNSGVGSDNKNPDNQ
jgi:molecular chaperone GrpE (heat shock protein)